MAATVTERPIPTGEGLTFEKVWAMFQETDLRFKETERLMKENADRLIKESAERQKETDRKMKEADQQMKKAIGKLGNRFGELVEHLVAPNLSAKFNELGFEFTDICGPYKFHEPGKPDTEAEIDVFLQNGEIAMAVEVKAKPNQDDVNDHVLRMEKLRRHFDRKQDKRRFQGAIAGAVMSRELQKYILKKGFYVIQQSGDTVQINIPDGFKPGEW